MAVPERNCSDTQSDVVDLTGLLFVYLVHRPIGWPNAVPASSRSPAGNANKITVIRIFDNYLITGLLFLFAFFFFEQITFPFFVRLAGTLSSAHD